MKSATIPPLRVTPELLEEALRKQIKNRKLHQEFMARGLASRDKAKATGNYVSKKDVMGSLKIILQEA